MKDKKLAVIFPYKAREIMNDKARMQEAFEIAASQIKEQCKRLELELYTVDGANHSLETDSVMADLANLAKIMEKVEQML